MKRFCFYLPILLSFYLFASCKQDNYDKGDGDYSLMRADFIEAHIGSDKRVDYIVTDDGDSLAAEPHFTTKSITVADTTYRAILYYNKVKGTSGKTVAEARAMSVVPTLFPQTPNTQSPTADEIKTDPVKFESIWLGGNRRYVNFSIILMTGSTEDDDLKHAIGLIDEGIVEYLDGKRTIRCRLYHDQNGIPEYYSQQHYISIPTKSMDADSLCLTINTYKGEIVKCIPLK